MTEPKPPVNPVVQVNKIIEQAEEARRLLESAVDNLDTDHIERVIERVREIGDNLESVNDELEKRAAGIAGAARRQRTDED